MLDIANAKVRRTANGSFDQTVFGEDPTVKRLTEELSEARHKCVLRKKVIILDEFRIAVEEFTLAFKETPSLVLMSYDDVHYLVEAYNAEGERLDESRPYLSVYADTKIVDGIEVKQGCDMKSGKICLSRSEFP